MELIYDFKRFSFSTQLAITCFCIGTFLFGLFFLLPENDGIVILGLIFIIFAAFLNVIVLLNLLFQFIVITQEREKITIKILILLSNIPIAYLYFFLILKSVSHNSPF